jgi:hypothetical protein
MLFYVLLGFSVLVTAFLLMITAQFISMERTIGNLTERTELLVRKIYEKV